ncbi:chymotrypsin-1-like [Pieris napi]|uniref:chymotrypsin-1-like n=1 Tax=Pieris napi TaxID=78633 RepID=UPI001FBA3465|nr:chymotrypsin-1-like [Pieris napi]
MYLYLFLLSTAITLGQAEDKFTNDGISPHIVGGSDAEAGEFPYLVSLRIRQKGEILDGHVCGGSILTYRWVVSAAHCTVNVKPVDIRIVAGSIKLSEGGSIYYVDRIVNGNFENRTKSDDISLIKTKTDIVFNKYVRSILLSLGPVPVGEDAMIVGWGFTDKYRTRRTDVLQKLMVHIRPYDVCLKYLPNYFKDTHTKICIQREYGKGVCHGESGSPLIYQGLLYGIASFNIDNHCGVGVPTVYTEVRPYMTWIYSTIYT